MFKLIVMAAALTWLGDYWLKDGFKEFVITWYNRLKEWFGGAK